MSVKNEDFWSRASEIGALGVYASHDDLTGNVVLKWPFRAPVDEARLRRVTELRIKYEQVIESYIDQLDIP